MKSRHRSTLEADMGALLRYAEDASRELTPVERRAVESLRRLAKRWPATIGLQAGTGGLNVIALDERGQFPEPGAAFHRAKLAHIEGIEADGGDPW